IPAAALVALLPGKASPLVFGGKIHTPHDTADRVYPKPLGEALRIIDYWLHLMQGGPRIAEPRDLDEYHYAQLFRVRRPGSAAAGEPRVREADPSDERRRIHFDAVARVREADPSDERRRIHFDAAARVREADPADDRRRIHFDAVARVREADPADERR